MAVKPAMRTTGVGLAPPSGAHMRPPLLQSDQIKASRVAPTKCRRLYGCESCGSANRCLNLVPSRFICAHGRKGGAPACGKAKPVSNACMARTTAKNERKTKVRIEKRMVICFDVLEKQTSKTYFENASII